MTEITIDSLTNTTLNGTGTFDKLMQTVKLHLHEEYSENRVRNAEYSSLYLGSLTTVIQQAMTFELQRGISAAQIDLTNKQIERTTAEIAGIEKQNEMLDKQMLKTDAEIALLDKDLLIKDAQIVQAGYQNALLAKQIVLADSQIALEQAKVINLGFQNDMIEAQIVKLGVDTDIARQQLEIEREKLLNMAAERERIVAETALVVVQTAKAQLELDNFRTVLNKLEADTLKAQAEAAMMDAKRTKYLELGGAAAEVNVLLKTAERMTAEVSKIDKENLRTDSEINLIKQKTATEIAETSNVIPTGVTPFYPNEHSVYSKDTLANGAIGVKLSLQDKQKDMFDRDAEMKVSKLLTDSWSIAKNISPDTINTSAALGVLDSKTAILEETYVAKDGLTAEQVKAAAIATQKQTYIHLTTALDKMLTGIGITPTQPGA